MEEKTYTEGIKPEGKFYRWFDNYWYHYKWHTLAALFVAIVLVVCTLQMCEKQKEDTTFLYAGPRQLSGEEVENIRGVLNAVMPEDYDKDGKKYAGIVDYLIYSEEQIKEIEASTDAYGVAVDVNNQYITNNYESYYDYLLSGESAVCFLDPHLYTELRKNGRLMTLVSVLGEDSGYGSESCGIILGKTEIYEEYSALRVLPEDTVVCVLKQVVMGRISNDEVYENELDIFRAIVNYTEEK